MADTVVMVQTTFAEEDMAVKMAGMALDARLAACVQYHPVQSMYRWQGRLENAREFVWTAKTSSDRSPALMELIKKHHPYEVPEILAFPAQAANPAYRHWVMGEVQS